MRKDSRRRWIVRAACALGLLIFIAGGLAHISFNVDILRLLPTNLRQVEGLSVLLREFGRPDELMITVEAPTADVAESAADGIAHDLAARPDLARSAFARAPWESDPAQLSELLAFLALNRPTEAIRALANRLSTANASATLQSTLQKLGDSISPQEIGMLSYDPYDLSGELVGPLIAQGQQSEFASADGTFHVVYVRAAQPFRDYNAAIAWVAAVQVATAKWEGRDGCRLGYTGEPAIVASISGSMQSDMQSSGLVTLLVIALIFWFCYRRLQPLLQLMGMLVLVFALTLAIAGWFFSQLTVIGVGSSAIMIGLSVDYGYFIYQRAQGFTGTLGELQRQCLRYITWTAGTTAAAFFALNVSSLPGLSQLGNLVGVGVVVGAIVMLTVFAPLVLRRLQREVQPRPPSAVERLVVSARFQQIGAIATSILAIGLLAALATRGGPRSDFSEAPLRPRNSAAYEALDRLTQRLTDQIDPLSLLVAGDSVDLVLTRLRDAEAQLDAARTRGEVQTFRSALPLWPDASRQRANLPVLAALAADETRLADAARAAGFRDEAFDLTRRVLHQWAAWAGQAPPIWPQNAASKWILDRAVREDGGKWYALGLVTPTPGREAALLGAVHDPGVYLTGWKLLTVELRQAIPREFERAIIGIAVIVLALLIVAFRDIRAVGLFVAATALVFACLQGAMSLLGMTWNFFNLAAVLLLLGTGTDYSILFLLALRRNGGDVPAARRELFLVICLCACSASAGFGTISWANHLGLASLGQTCALGLLIDAAISVFLLPLAWKWLSRGRIPEHRWESGSE